MFEPELFGFAASRYYEFAVAALVTPTLAFAFLFLLALPLRRLPFIGELEGYQPPEWVLSVFSLGSALALSYCLGVSFFLTEFRASPSVSDFLSSFEIILPIELPTDKRLSKMLVTIEAYDGRSNFRVFANGYRVFSSEANCRLVFQCKPTQFRAFQNFRKSREFAKLRNSEWSLDHLDALYSLPYTEDASPFLIEGKNTVDLLAENSAVETCNLTVSFMFEFSGTEIERTIVITPKEPKAGDKAGGMAAVPITDGLRTTWTFNSGATAAEGEVLPFYLTNTANQSYRLCERLRFAFDLSNKQTPDIVNDKERLTEWYHARFDRWEQ